MLAPKVRPELRWRGSCIIPRTGTSTALSPSCSRPLPRLRPTASERPSKRRSMRRTTPSHSRSLIASTEIIALLSVEAISDRECDGVVRRILLRLLGRSLAVGRNLSKGLLQLGERAVDVPVRGIMQDPRHLSSGLTFGASISHGHRTLDRIRGYHSGLVWSGHSTQQIDAERVN